MITVALAAVACGLSFWAGMTFMANRLRNMCVAALRMSLVTNELALKYGQLDATMFGTIEDIQATNRKTLQLMGEKEI
jgi:hypothetical protein